MTIAAVSLASAHSVSATTYSTSRTGVVIMFMTLRLHVSSMKPVATETSVWKRKWLSMIPASRYGAADCAAPPCWATKAPMDPNRITSMKGNTTMRNQRSGVRPRT